jgi:hypothetical protein
MDFIWKHSLYTLSRIYENNFNPLQLADKSTLNVILKNLHMKKLKKGKYYNKKDQT